MTINTRQFLHLSGLFFASALPRWVFADGGISAIGALFPVFVVLGLLVFMVLFWLTYSAAIFFTSEDKLTRKRIRNYKVFSILTVVLLLAAVSVGTMLAGGLSLLLLLTMIIVVTGSLAIISRAEKLLVANTETKQ